MFVCCSKASWPPAITVLITPSVNPPFTTALPNAAFCAAIAVSFNALSLSSPAILFLMVTLNACLYAVLAAWPPTPAPITLTGSSTIAPPLSTNQAPKLLFGSFQNEGRFS